MLRILGHLCFFSVLLLRAQAGGVEVKVTLTCGRKCVDISISGPINVWYGVGFGRDRCDDAYVLLRRGGNWEERRLSFQQAGSQLLPSPVREITLDEPAGGMQTSVLRRLAMPRSTRHFNFSTLVASQSLPIIWAYGTGKTLSKHAMRANATIAVEANGVNCDCFGYTWIPDTTTTTTTTTVTSQEVVVSRPRPLGALISGVIHLEHPRNTTLVLDFVSSKDLRLGFSRAVALALRANVPEFAVQIFRVSVVARRLDRVEILDEHVLVEQEPNQPNPARRLSHRFQELSRRLREVVSVHIVWEARLPADQDEKAVCEKMRGNTADVSTNINMELVNVDITSYQIRATYVHALAGQAVETGVLGQSASRSSDGNQCCRHSLAHIAVALGVSLFSQRLL